MTLGSAIGRFVKLRHMSIYTKLVLSFLLMIVPMAVLSLYLNDLSKNNIKTEISESVLSRLHFYRVSFETEITRINKMMKEYINDDDLIKLSGIHEAMEDFEKTQTILRLQKKLSFMKDSSLYIKRTQLFIPALDRTISETVDPEMRREEVEYLRHIQRKGYPYISVYEGKLVAGQVYPQLLKPDQEPVFVLEIEFSQTAIESALREVVDTSMGGGALLLQRDRDWFVSATDDSDLNGQFAALIHDSFDGQDVGQRTGLFHNKRYIVSYENIPAIGMMLAVWQPEKNFLGALDQYYVWFWIIFGASLLIIILFSLWIYRLIHKPLRRLVRAFGKMEEGNLKVKLEVSQQDEFGYLYGQFNHMTGRLQQLVYEVYEQKIISQRSELKQLQAQINPHFLYNSLFMLKRMVVSGNTEQSVSLIQHIGDYFRYMTRNSADEVPLAAEWKHLGAYIEIQKMRFSRRIKIDISELPASLQQLAVPKLIIQPLVENIYQHGLKSKDRDGYAVIEAGMDDGLVCIRIQDNGETLQPGTLAQLSDRLLHTEDRELETTALINIHRRLRLKYGKRSGLRVGQSAYGGFLVELIIEPSEG